MSLPHVPLLGQAVRLEPLSLEHVPALWAVARSIPEASRITLVPSSEAATRSYVEQALALAARDAALPYAVYGVEQAAIVGTTRFANFERWGLPQRAHAALDVLEVGWTILARAAQRTAINSEMKYLMLRHAFEELGVLRVTIKTDVNNTQSRAAIERLGARFEGILRNHMPNVTGGVRDTAMYSVIAQDWVELRRVLENRLGR
jgi:RimJ/RimL family protein N-acetyltransferase